MGKQLTLYGMDSKKIDVAEIFFLSVMKPCVKCPPSGKSNPMIRPWGSTRAVYTAKLAGDPKVEKKLSTGSHWVFGHPIVQMMYLRTGRIQHLIKLMAHFRILDRSQHII